MGGITLPDIKFLLYSCNNQSSVALAGRWIYRSKEQNIGSRHRSTHMLSCFLTKVQNQFKGGRIASSTNGAVAV